MRAVRRGKLKSVWHIKDRLERKKSVHFVMMISGSAEGRFQKRCELAETN